MALRPETICGSRNRCQVRSEPSHAAHQMVATVTPTREPTRPARSTGGLRRSNRCATTATATAARMKNSGPNAWRASAVSGSPCANATQDRASPQPGHGIPVAKRNGQTTGPSSIVVCGIATAATRQLKADPAIARSRRPKSRSSALKRKSVGVTNPVQRKQDYVDDHPDPQAAAGQQFDDPEPDVAYVEPVDTEEADEDRQE
jgi:hypothetical protein